MYKHIHIYKSLVKKYITHYLLFKNCEHLKFVLKDHLRPTDHDQISAFISLNGIVLKYCHKKKTR